MTISSPLPRRRGRRARTALLLALLLPAPAAAVAAPGTVPAAAGAEPPATPPPAAIRERSELLAAFRVRMRENDLAGAAAAARRCLAQFPDDGAMAYNLACVQARRGETAEAWAALERALASPQADPRLAERDPDLQALRGDARYARLLADTRERLRARAGSARIALRAGYPGAVLTLPPADGAVADAAWPRVTVRLTATDGGLTLDGEVRDSHFRDRRQPWLHGDGFRVTLTPPPEHGDSGFDAAHSFVFGFGLQEGSPVGALIELDGRTAPLEVVELAPKVRFDATGGTASYAMFVPWTAIAPYAPPADTLLGLNVSYLSVGNDRVRRTVALTPDPALAGGESGPWRRCVPLACRPSDRSQPALRGALSNAVVADAPLAITLAAWLPRAAAATLRVEILDVTGRSVVSGGGSDEVKQATAGLNRWRRTADLSALPYGPFRVRAALAVAGLDTLRWQTEVLRLADDWLDKARTAAAAVPALERPSLDYRLEAIADALAGRPPRALPSPLATTWIEARALLQRQARTGRVLPDSGAFLAAYRDGAGTLRPCEVRLPAKAGRAGRLLLVLAGRGEAAGHVGEALVASSPLGDDCVVAAPALPGDHDAAGGDPAAAALAALRWARERFPTRETLVAGLDAGAADALALTLAQPGLCDRALLLVGAGVDPWRDVAPDALATTLRARPNRVRYTVVDGGRATAADGRASTAADIATLLGAAGFLVERGAGKDDTLTLRWASETLAGWAAGAR